MTTNSCSFPALRLAALVAAASLGGCAPGRSDVHVQVTGGLGGLEKLMVTVTNGGMTSKAASFAPAQTPFALPFDFSLVFDSSRHGAADINVEAWGGGKLVASGVAHADLQPSHSIEASVMLGPAALDAGNTTDMALPDLSLVDLSLPVNPLDMPPSSTILGDDALETSVDVHNVGLADASRAVATATGMIRSLSFYNDSGDATSLIIGVYTDLGGHPHTLLVQASVPLPKVNTWVTVPISPIPVVKDLPYWIALVAPVAHGKTFAFRYGNDSPLASTEHSRESNLAQLPDTWSIGDTFPRTFCSFYGSM